MNIEHGTVILKKFEVSLLDVRIIIYIRGARSRETRSYEFASRIQIMINVKLRSAIWFLIVRRETQTIRISSSSSGPEHNHTSVMELWLHSCTVAKVQRTASATTTHTHTLAKNESFWMSKTRKNRASNDDIAPNAKCQMRKKHKFGYFFCSRKRCRPIWIANNDEQRETFDYFCRCQVDLFHFLCSLRWTFVLTRRFSASNRFIGFANLHLKIKKKTRDERQCRLANGGFMCPRRQWRPLIYGPFHPEVNNRMKRTIELKN